MLFTINPFSSLFLGCPFMLLSNSFQELLSKEYSSRAQNRVARLKKNKKGKLVLALIFKDAFLAVATQLQRQL